MLQLRNGGVLAGAGANAAGANASKGTSAGARAGSCAGSSAGSSSKGGHLRDALPLAEQWAWCLSCSHGGHAAHVEAWFEANSVCAVAGCFCQCALL